MDISDLLIANGYELPLPEFKPYLGYFTELSLLIWLLEDISYVSHWVNSSMSIYLCENRLVGIEFWLHYHPQLLLPAPA